MKKSLLLAIALIISFNAFSQGGMWLPVLAENHIKDMQHLGFKLSADDIYSINKACMKDAVVLFGGGCTGEIVSDKGLLFTNHHCGRGEIVSHSTLEHDYLTDGFWAKSLNEELVCTNLNVLILEQMIELPQDEELSKKLVDETKNKFGENFYYSVEKFYGGNVSYLFVYKKFCDVRLVGAPPSAIGGFGGDTDNWMWPRHGGDFSVFRIYADKNNNPTKGYSVDNVPYKPKYHFKISLKGVEKDDFTMVFGFPGETQEYLPSCAVKYYSKQNYPARIFCRAQRMAIMDEAMNRDRGVRLKYTSLYSYAENAKKKWEGAVIGLNRFDAIGVKKAEENIIKKDSYISKQLEKYEELYEKNTSAMMADAYFLETIYQTFQFKAGEKAYRLSLVKVEDSPQEILSMVNTATENTLRLFASRDSAVERNIFNAMLKIYLDSCAAFVPEKIQKIITENNLKTSQDFVNYYYNNSYLADSVRFKNLVSKYIYPDKNRKKFETRVLEFSSIIQNDIGIIFYFDMIKLYFDKIAPQVESFEQEHEILDKRYQAFLLKHYPEKIKFPDANSTLRFTYGKADGFRPKDGVIYDYFTTLEGVMEKDNPEIYDYNTPEKLKTLFLSKDFGRYADKDGKIHVCFVASNHTTGGNSGSPVINSKGELIGINFDRCWEGTMSDLMYNPEICRNISVDIRYVLFLIDKLGGAKNIINELTIVE